MPFKLTKMNLKDKTRYTPHDLISFSEKELRAEYRRLRDIAQKRLMRLRKKYPDNYVLDYHPTGFKKLEDLKSKSDLRLALADVSKFVNLPSTTLKGQKRIQEERYQRLLDKGYLTGNESDEDRKALMKFVHWVAKTIKENVMYRDKWGEKIRDDKFKDEIRKGNYGQAYEDLKAAEQGNLPPTKANASIKGAQDFDDYREKEFNEWLKSLSIDWGEMGKLPRNQPADDYLEGYDIDLDRGEFDDL